MYSGSMGNMKVYRVEHRETREGPYNAGIFFGRIVNKAWDEGMFRHPNPRPHHPSPHCDGVWEGWDTVENDRFGFQHMELFEKWFGRFETMLHDWGYVLAVYEVDEMFVKLGEHQCAFDHRYATRMEDRALAEGPLHELDPDTRARMKRNEESRERTTKHMAERQKNLEEKFKDAYVGDDGRWKFGEVRDSQQLLDPRVAEQAAIYTTISKQLLTGTSWLDEFVENTEKEERTKWPLGKLSIEWEPSKLTPTETLTRPHANFAKCSLGYPMTSLSRLQSLKSPLVLSASTSTSCV